MKSRQSWNVAATAALGAACVIWAAIPLAGTLATVVLVVGAACAALSAARLWLGAPTEPGAFFGPVEHLVQDLARLPRAAPWAEAMVVCVLVLEALHASRPWHTVVLGVALLASVLSAHLAESRAGAAALRPQASLLLIGLGLLVLAAGAAMLPAVTGPAASLMAVAAALAAIAVGAAALRT